MRGFGVQRLAIGASLVCLAAFLTAVVPAGAASDSIRGTIQVTHSDDFGSGRSTYGYDLTTSSGRRYRIDPRGRDLPSGSDAASLNGYRATVRGSARGGVLREQSTRLSRPAARSAGAGASAASSDATITRRVAIVNIQFSTPARFPNSLLETAARDLNTFLGEASGNQMQIAGVDHENADILGPYTVAKTSETNPKAKCDRSWWTRQAMDQASAEGKDIGYAAPGSDPTYDTVVFVFPHSGCGYGGISSLGPPDYYRPQQDIWLNGGAKLKMYVLAHEMGHVLGVNHTNRATGGLFDGLYREGGDPFDVMGNGKTVAQFNTFFKAQMASYGTFPPVPNEYLQYATEARSYTLSPNNSALGGRQALLIPRPVEGGVAGNGPFFALEVRHPFGVFNLNPRDSATGVSVRMVPDLANNVRGSILEGKPVRPGGTFNDPASGISITVNSISADGTADVTITPATRETAAPEAPTNLRATKLPGGGLQFDWNGTGLFDLGHFDFIIRRNGELLNWTRLNQWSLRYSWSGTYTVAARDYWGNESAPASVVVDFSAPSGQTNKVGLPDGSQPGSTGTAPTGEPSVTIVSPSDGATVGSNVDVSVKASDSGGVKRIRLLVDGSLRTTWTPARPLQQAEWTFPDRYLSKGTHTIAAEATDTDSNAASYSVKVTRP